MGYYCSTEWGNRLELRVDPGPDYKNDLKLCLNEARKQYGATHTFKIERRKSWNYDTRSYQYEDIFVGIPSLEYLAVRKAEIRAWEEHEEAEEFYRILFKHLIEDDDRYLGTWDSKPYKRTQGERRPKKPGKFPGRGKPDLSEEDSLEERLSQPRARYQRGWKRIYKPTAKTWRRHDDHKSWKTNRKGCKSWNK